MENLNGETKNGIDFIPGNKVNTVKNVAVLNKLKSSNHRMLRCTLMLDIQRERENLFRMKKSDISKVKEKSDEFPIRIQTNNDN